MVISGKRWGNSMVDAGKRWLTFWGSIESQVNLWFECAHPTFLRSEKVSYLGKETSQFSACGHWCPTPRIS